MRDVPGIRVEASARRTADRVRIEVRLRIPDRVHVEPHEPPDPLLVPTVVTFDDLEVESASYPAPTEKDLGLPGPPLLVYEGTVTVTAEGHVGEELDVARGVVRYQPCVGGACLPPEEKPWRAPIVSEVASATGRAREAPADPRPGGGAAAQT